MGTLQSSFQGLEYSYLHTNRIFIYSLVFVLHSVIRNFNNREQKNPTECLLTGCFLSIDSASSWLEYIQIHLAAFQVR